MLRFILTGLDKYPSLTEKRNLRKGTFLAEQKGKSLWHYKTKLGEHIFYFICFMGREILVRERNKKHGFCLYSS